MANFCANCGAKLSQEAIFCPVCGTRTASQPAGNNAPQTYQTAPQQPVQPTPQQAYQPAQPVYPPQYQQSAPVQKEQKPKKKSSALTALIIVLVAVIAVEGVIAGIWYPGFFTGGKDDGNRSGSTVETPLTEANFYKGEISAEGTGFSDMLDDFNTTTATNDITLRYTEDQVKNAPEETAALTTDGGEVTAGAVKATFTDFDLQEDCDLVVKDLPTLREERGEDEPDVKLKAYDITLSSGQHQFASEIELDIPRTVGDNETGSIIWFNEEMNRWENIYSEISEDGKYYHVYTTHFTEYAEKIYVYDRSTKTIKDGEYSVNLDSGIFTRTDAHGNISFDENQLWALANLKDADDINRFADVIKTIDNWDKVDATYNKVSDRGNTASAMFGLKGNVGSIVEILNGSGKFSLFLKSLGKACTIADAALTVAKILYETTYNGKKSGYLASFCKACEDHALDIGSGILGIASLLPKFAAASPYLFVASVALYGISMYLTYAKQPEKQWMDEDFSTADGFYRYFLRHEHLCFDGLAPASQYDSNKHYFIDVDGLPNLSEEEFERFKKRLVEVKNKDAYFKNNTAELTVERPVDWSYVFQALMWSCDDPATFNAAVDDLFIKVANSYWNLDRDTFNRYLADNNSRLEWDKRNQTNGIQPAIEGERDLTTVEKLSKVNEMVEFLKKKYAPVLKKAATTLIHDVMNKSVEEIERMVKYLNSYMEFYVEDVNVDDFSDSIYCADYKTIPNNKEQWEKTHNLNDIFLPIRFHDVTQTYFTAIDAASDSGERFGKENYYPYRMDSAPTINFNDYFGTYYYDEEEVEDTPSLNRVYVCRVYDYLAMGAPTQMDFYDPSTIYSENPECVTVDMVFPSKVTPGQPMKVTATVGGDVPADIAPLLGKWAIDGDEDHKTYAIAEEQLTLPDGGKREIVLCTQKDEIYTLKLVNKEGEKPKTEYIELKLLAENRLQICNDNGADVECTRIDGYTGKWKCNNARNNTWQIETEGDQMVLMIGGYSKEANEYITFNCDYKFEDGSLLIYCPAFPKGNARLTPQKNGSMHVEVTGDVTESFTMTRM